MSIVSLVIRQSYSDVIKALATSSSGLTSVLTKTCPLLLLISFEDNPDIPKLLLYPMSHMIT
jgi:hypothetical protein